MLDKNSNASRLVEKLKQKQLVDRCECPEDRRAVNVRITDKGLELLAKLDNTDESIRIDLGTITEEDANMVNTILDKLRG
jgi:DNA-binding MarR family transcriptional regulator